MNNHRIILIDFIRGIAIILMIISHFFSLLDAKIKTNYSNHPIPYFLGTISRFLFIFLLGFSFKLSKQNKHFFSKNMFKSLQLICFALLINLITFFVYPDNYVRFGILHFLSLSLLLLLILEKKHFSTPLFVGILLYLIYFYILSEYKTNNLLLSSLGISPNYSTMDYFPLCKWFWLVSAGYFLSHYIDIKPSRVNNNLVQCISVIGRHSLTIYLVHFPCLFLLHKLLKYY